ncbi:MAG: hypothetical protein ACREI7_03370, partial [Myxococcota bacterium]
MRFAVSALLWLTLAASPVAARAAANEGSDEASSALASAHAALWDELENAARDAAERLGAPPSDASLQRAFEDLVAAARELGGRR